MQNKKFLLSAVLLLAFGLTGLHAQEAISASGGNGSGSGGSASYTIGQVFYNVNTGSASKEFQGVQQPFEISVVTATEEAKDISLDFIVYPNPTSDYVILKTGTYDVTHLHYYLYNNNGVLLGNNIVQDYETTISMLNLKPSTYFLKIIDNNKVIKIFKIIKN
jgi:hypothetical protein